MARTHFRLRTIYYGMKRRCYKNTCSDYKDYGGRGITVCKLWLEDINSFIVWSLSNVYMTNYSLDRIDVNGSYSPENCRLVGVNTQAQNRRKPRTNTSNYIGVSFHKETNKWRAYDAYVISNNLKRDLNFK